MNKPQGRPPTTPPDKWSGQHAAERDAAVRNIILIEGLANLAVLVAKLMVGVGTGSLAILGDAIHSLTDVINNVVAWVVVRVSGKPADREHPYGHRKFETLAVFGLAALMSILAFELVLHAIRREQPEIVSNAWSVALMAAVLGVNTTIAIWQRYWARRLGSDILLADANHTFADVLTTMVVIGGWQLSAMGYPWLDAICAIAVSGLILYLSYSLFKRVFPILVDRIAIEPEVIIRLAQSLAGVHNVVSVRSRWIGTSKAVDMVITVDPRLDIEQAHRVADDVEKLLEKKLGVKDVSIHIEPDG